MPSKIRLQRIAERIREQFAEILLVEINDPRLTGISVTDVEIDRELAFADIYISAVEGQLRAKEVLGVLNHANGYIRRLLSDKIELRTFPILRFHWDPTPERVDNLEKLFHELHEESKKDKPIA